nr:SDR family NAD(P)-dependent oxidoreductase [Thiobacillaceae bacterium]
ADAWLGRYTVDGTLDWLARAGGGGTVFDSANGVAVAPSGDVFVAGQAGGSADFGSQTLTVSGSGNVDLAILRAPGIYAGDRLPADRVRKALPAIVAEDDVHTNHIHAQDLARLALAALFRGRANRIYNAVDDSGLKMGDWFDVVADHLGLPRPPRLPRADVMAAVTPAMRTFLSESRRLLNGRVKTELRFRFRYPNVKAGLNT